MLIHKTLTIHSMMLMWCGISCEFLIHHDYKARWGCLLCCCLKHKSSANSRYQCLKQGANNRYYPEQKLQVKNPKTSGKFFSWIQALHLTSVDFSNQSKSLSKDFSNPVYTFSA